MTKNTQDLYGDIAPLEGRTKLSTWQVNAHSQNLTWEGTDCSLTEFFPDLDSTSERTIRLQGSIHPKKSTPTPGWIELETTSGKDISITDLYLVGTRPLPQPNITCISRHPLYRDYLVAGTADSQLLLLDARLNANLKILKQVTLKAPLVSLVCCGKRLLGLEKSPGKILHIIDIDTRREALPGFLPVGQLSLPVVLNSLAENDFISAWGLTGEGDIYKIILPGSQLFSQPHRLILGKTINKMGRLCSKQFILVNILDCVKGFFQAIKNGQPPWRSLCFESGPFLGLAYDGKHFWSFHQHSGNETGGILLLFNQDGSLIRSFGSRPEAAISALNYFHNNLLVLDLEHQQLHQYHAADTMVPMASLTPLNYRHPGYLPAGTPITGGIHDLCLLYVGGEGSSSVHRYDIDKLRPLVGFLSPDGFVQDFFMDGFLLLAQYSPLLNGRSFGVDLEGQPSRKEDWLALFDEYFHPQANLPALENCAKEISHQLGASQTRPIKVVLSIPTADSRCPNWDNEGLSLAEDARRVEVTHWAIKVLLDRWKKAGFQHLVLAGFYYMTEQGAWNDQVLQTFPQLCRKYKVRSFAIPGISSSWITEFNRAGFDCVTLQSSSAFWQPANRPPRYLLKCAGRIAREFGMGMEVELPFDVLEPTGRQKLRDYLDMAHIQGWAGTFKAYFQSYNLIKELAESKIPECRQLYEDLYHLSRLSYPQNHNPAQLFRNIVNVDCQGKWTDATGQTFICLNIEGHRGVFKLMHLSVE